MPKIINCIKVPKKHGEKAISLLSRLNLFDKSVEIKRNESFLCIPLVRPPIERELLILQNQLSGYYFTKELFVKKQQSYENFMQVLEKKLPPHLFSTLPQALDIIGDIAVIEIPLELKTYQNAIGEAILQTHGNIRTVLAKAGAISGPYRVRGYTFIAGEQKTQTIHKEFGCQFHVDIAKAYFSPRLSYEHERIAALVRADETVLDLFAGVGPFSVLIAKKNPKVKVYAVDINPEAVDLLKVNVRVNRVENRVFPILGDARQVSATKLKGTANRIIMNLPETAIEFVDAACQAIKPEGGIIHFYSFVRSPNTISNQKLSLVQAIENSGRKMGRYYSRNVRETAPYESQIVLDAKIASFEHIA